MRIIRKKKLLLRFNMDLNLFSTYKTAFILKRKIFKKDNSDYLSQLREIQMIRILYGVSFYIIKKFILGIKNNNKNIYNIFIDFFCCRIDYILYKSGSFNTRLFVKQLISHKLVLLNGIKINIHSIIIKNNDRILFLSKFLVKPLNVVWFKYNNLTNEYIFVKKLYLLKIENINLYVVISFF